MKGVHLRLYTYEYRKHHGEPVYAWLLDHARKLGIPGGSAYRAMAGYGRHGLRHEQHFFELAGRNRCWSSSSCRRNKPTRLSRRSKPKAWICSTPACRSNMA